MSLTILSLFDYTGNWSKPYREAGYDVQQYDLKLGKDVRDIRYDICCDVHGILAAPPCTAFAGSGARWWRDKDRTGSTFEGLSLVDAVMRLVRISSPSWWVLENPVGRLKNWIGPPRMYFNPCDYGDPYTKKTCLWGDFNTDLPRNPVEPERVCEQGSWIQKLGGTSERTKELRSATPLGFSYAFFKANP